MKQLQGADHWTCFWLEVVDQEACSVRQVMSKYSRILGCAIFGIKLV